MTGENFAEHIFVKCPTPHTKNGQRKWHLTVLEDFDIEQWGEPTTTPIVVVTVTYTICKGPN